MRRLVPALASALCLALLVASPAFAGPRPRPAARLRDEVARIDRELQLLGRTSGPPGLPRHGVVVRAGFENRDGYDISVLAYGQTVVLGVSRGHGIFDSRASLYLAHGKVTPTSVRASFAGRGSVVLRLRPGGRVLRLPGGLGCRQPASGVVGRSGVYVGRVSFNGEAGFTSVDAHRVPGAAIDVGALTACLGPLVGRAALPATGVAMTGAAYAVPPVPGTPTHPTPGPKPTALSTDAKLPLSRTVFVAEGHGTNPPFFLAASQSSEGALGIARYVVAEGAPASFSFDDSLSRASVTPPPPFSGTATFEHGLGGARSWSGSLAVSFLGMPRVPLTGPEFAVALARGF
jgi:hypothetical protein